MTSVPHSLAAEVGPEPTPAGVEARYEPNRDKFEPAAVRVCSTPATAGLCLQPESYAVRSLIAEALSDAPSVPQGCEYSGE